MRRLRGVVLVRAQAEFDERIVRTMVGSISKDDVELVRDLIHSSVGFVYESFRSAVEDAHHSAGGDGSSSPAKEEQKPSSANKQEPPKQEHKQEPLLSDVDDDLKFLARLHALEPAAVKEWLLSRNVALTARTIGVPGVIEAAKALRAGEDYPRGHNRRLARDLLRYLKESD